VIFSLLKPFLVIYRLVFTHPSKIPQKYCKNPSTYLPILQKYLKNTAKILQIGTALAQHRHDTVISLVIIA